MEYFQNKLENNLLLGLWVDKVSHETKRCRMLRRSTAAHALFSHKRVLQSLGLGGPENRPSSRGLARFMGKRFALVDDNARWQMYKNVI